MIRDRAGSVCIELKALRHGSFQDIITLVTNLRILTASLGVKDMLDSFIFIRMFE